MHENELWYQFNKILSKIRLTFLNPAQNTYGNFTDNSHDLRRILKHTAKHFTRRDESQTETRPYLQFKFKECMHVHTFHKCVTRELKTLPRSFSSAKEIREDAKCGV